MSGWEAGSTQHIDGWAQERDRRMKERPILFSGPMVRAILDVRKTQTRRVVKPQPQKSGRWWSWKNWEGSDDGDRFGPMLASIISANSSYGAPGDRLWVREEHYRFGHWEPVPGVRTKTGRMKWRFVADSQEVCFDAPDIFRKGRHHKDPGTPAWHKRLARFMPRLASRITLEITDVRVERLQDISEEDAMAEGCEWQHWTFPNSTTPGKTSYCVLWESINGAGSWDANPWVCVVSFRRIEP